MTQDSDSGEAVGDAGPTSDRSAYCCLKVKKVLSWRRDRRQNCSAAILISPRCNYLYLDAREPVDASGVSRQKLPGRRPNKVINVCKPTDACKPMERNDALG